MKVKIHSCADTVFIIYAMLSKKALYLHRRRVHTAGTDARYENPSIITEYQESEWLKYDDKYAAYKADE